MQTVVISGGTGALGHAVVPHLLRDAVCVVLYRDADGWNNLKQALGAHERLVGCREGDDLGGFAPIHALVTLAGAFSLEDDYERMLDANLMSFVRAMRGVRPHLADGARIVAVSSIATIETPGGMHAYVASKSALNSVILTTAKELAPRHITANALLPSALDTPASRQSTPREQLVPLDRVAVTIAFLLSDAGASITGQLIALRA
jgi:NAD(P)-dependent dehydrogenase (short-subunit alcohol dehydrogenase family)